MPPTIQPLSAVERDYLSAFNLTCVAISPSGRVYVSHNPVGASLAWWCRAADAGQVARVAWMDGDVPGAAQRLGVTVTAHAVVAARVKERTAKIDQAIAAAINAGVLQQFNAEYRKRRLAAKRDGKHFMSYAEALRRLRRYAGQQRGHLKIVC
jgi:hypothetical protein